MAASGKSRDPVCGMEIQDWDAVFVREHAGRAYRFCSPVCRERFDREPERYVTAQTNATPSRAPSRTKVKLPIRDLSCGGGGALTIERLLRQLPGVSSVYVNPATEIAYVECDPTRVDEAALRKAVRQAGYEAA